MYLICSIVPLSYVGPGEAFYLLRKRHDHIYDPGSFDLKAVRKTPILDYMALALFPNAPALRFDRPLRLVIERLETTCKDTNKVRRTP